jgi:hypothetical protein
MSAPEERDEQQTPSETTEQVQDLPRDPVEASENNEVKGGSTVLPDSEAVRRNTYQRLFG